MQDSDADRKDSVLRVIFLGQGNEHLSEGHNFCQKKVSLGHGRLASSSSCGLAKAALIHQVSRLLFRAKPASTVAPARQCTHMIHWKTILHLKTLFRRIVAHKIANQQTAQTKNRNQWMPQSLLCSTTTSPADHDPFGRGKQSHPVAVSPFSDIMEPGRRNPYRHLRF